ncbi:hypothetical protein LCGC14_1231030 [marine sediment metagenome]|uniref:DUF1937 domain-containing protein n=1 Tax=marine sediment metagenome TaxID=412755 RepID=A0A0F9LVQ9_9ZZZZ
MSRSIYLASPYSDPDAAVRQGRYEAVFAATRRLMAEGLIVFSPIVYSHQFALLDGPGDWESWREFDTHMLREMQQLSIYTIPGWEDSVGVWAERTFAQKFAMAVRYELPTDAELALLKGETP